MGSPTHHTPDLVEGSHQETPGQERVGRSQPKVYRGPHSSIQCHEKVPEGLLFHATGCEDTSTINLDAMVQGSPLGPVIPELSISPRAVLGDRDSSDKEIRGSKGEPIFLPSKC